MITAPGYDDYEMFYPFFRLQEEGIDVEVASVERGEVKGNYFTIQAALSYQDIKPEEYSAVILPGGSAPETVRMYPEAVKAVGYFMDHGLPVAAICHGLQTLITLGALRGKNCTCYASIKDDIINAGASYTDAAVVIDNNLITSRCPQDLPQFMKAITEHLIVGKEKTYEKA